MSGRRSARRGAGKGLGTGARRGLTLLETLVALLIATAGFGALLTTLSQSKRTEASAGRAERELILARSLLEQAFVGAMPKEGSVRPESGVERWAGETDGLRWVVDVRSTIVHGKDLAKRDPAAAALLVVLSDEPEQGPAMLSEIIRVEVGRVRLSSARW